MEQASKTYTVCLELGKPEVGRYLVSQNPNGWSWVWVEPDEGGGWFNEFHAESYPTASAALRSVADNAEDTMGPTHIPRTARGMATRIEGGDQ